MSGGLPDSWALVPLGLLAAEEERAITDGPFGSNLKSSHYTTEGPRVIRLQNISEGAFRDVAAHISDEHFQKLRQHEAQPEDIVVASLGAQLPTACVVPDWLGPAIVKADCIRVRVNERIVSPRYLMWALNSRQTRRRATSLIHGVSRPRLNLSSLRKLEVPLAPSGQQVAIVGEIETQFSRLDAGLAALERAQANLDRYRSSVLRAACEGRLVPTEAELAHAEGREYEPAEQLLERILAERRRHWEEAQLEKMRAKGKAPKDDGWKKKYKEPEPPDTGDLAELPEGWCWARMEQLGDVIGGLTKNRNRQKLELSLPYLRVANVYANCLDLKEVHEIGVKESELDRTLLEVDDLLIVEGNGSLDQIGRVARWDGSIDRCAHQNHLIKVRLYVKASAPYVLQWLLSREGRRIIARVASSTSGLYNLSLSKVANLPVPLPPLAEQVRIAEEVQRLESVTNAARSQVRANRTRASLLRQSILKRAFEGKLVPQDPDDEPASALLERIRCEQKSESGTQRSRRPKGAQVR